MGQSATARKLMELKQFLMEPSDLFTLIQAIPDNYRIIAPKAEGYALNYGLINNPREIALGYISHEDRGLYRLHKDEGSISLDRARTMNSPKWFTERPDETIFMSKRKNGSFVIEKPAYEPRPQAFVLIKSCDATALYWMDKAFNGHFRDPMYDSLREDNIIIAMSCFHPGKNCFCATFDSGPTLEKGYDILLSDLGGKYLLEIGSETGADLASQISLKPAAQDNLSRKDMMIGRAKRSMSKAFNINKAYDVLTNNYNHPFWKQLSDKCFSCSNCVSVCPLCFCYQTVDQTDVKQTQTRHSRQWDACQSPEFARVAGHNFREERVHRLKHWCNHKIKWQHEQMGSHGCVGCGRCVTWCPIGIDITEPIWHMGGKEIGLYAENA